MSAKSPKKKKSSKKMKREKKAALYDKQARAKMRGYIKTISKYNEQYKPNNLKPTERKLAIGIVDRAMDPSSIVSILDARKMRSLTSTSLKRKTAPKDSAWIKFFKEERKKNKNLKEIGIAWKKKKNEGEDDDTNTKKKKTKKKEIEEVD
jgi:hypothetical protein